MEEGKTVNLAVKTGENEFWSYDAGEVSEGQRYRLDSALQDKGVGFYIGVFTVKADKQIDNIESAFSLFEFSNYLSTIGCALKYSDDYRTICLVKESQEAEVA